MTKDKALKMAIEWFERKGYSNDRQPILEALQKALEQPAPSWQGLSDDEIEQAILSKNKAGEWWGMCLDIARAIEQALKEKNT